jgi:hypothetical protein
MINIDREANVPTSLGTQVIQDYITNLQTHLANPKVIPKPTKPPNYRTSDLLDAFDRCFFAKCYLTEKGFANSYAMDVEHFVPQNENPSLRFTWTNLLPADHIANMIKPRNTPTGGYLDPCDAKDDVESEIIYSLSIMGDTPKFQARNSSNAKAVNTCTLLNRIHNGHDINTVNSTKDLRHSIQKKYITILNKILEWKDYPIGNPMKDQAERQLRDLLSRRSSYTMLMRSMPAVLKYVPGNFLD